MRRKLWLAILVAVMAVGVAVAAGASFGQGGGAVANFTPGTNKIVYSGWNTPLDGGLSHYSDLGRVQLPVGSYTVTAHTVVQLAQAAPSGTVVECYLAAPNVNPQYTAATLSPGSGTNIASLDVQTISNAPNGGNADLFCRVNTRSDSKLVTSKSTSLIATPVSGASWTANAAPAFGSY